MSEIPLAPVDRIIRSCGADRVSEEAKEELSIVMEEYGKKLSEQASKLAEHADRKTVKSEDIKLASDRL
ncbi:MAG: Histones H3 and H4 [Candidatus Methanohalarchaeum thermophilum]|uniref:Histones H3 and H4 n=1 Tax=Methanohalarchaeum thermophilum TaxID=1903181 RepID=A0A1Q6DU18_METT1|nr:MAG: Histones H3 and H4 [Candidatus Methanohalarchaeum thermophilum]